MIQFLLPFALWFGWLGTRQVARRLTVRQVTDTSVYEAAIQGRDPGPPGLTHLWLQAGVKTLQVVSWLFGVGFLTHTVFAVKGLLAVL